MWLTQYNSATQTDVGSQMSVLAKRKHIQTQMAHLLAVVSHEKGKRNEHICK